MSDLLPKDITGLWRNFNPEDIFWIKELEKINLPDIFLALSLSQRYHTIADLDRQLPMDRPIILSFHMEYFWHTDLIRWFRSRPNQKFLLLSDWKTCQDFWPANVTSVRWITWHHQLNKIISHYGICDVIKPPIKKFSSLSHLHEYHKAVITSFVLSKFSRQDLELSWHDVRYPSRMYYLQEGYHIHPTIQNYVKSDWFTKLEPIFSDGKPGTPLENSNWRHLAYADCAVNLTNESVFNSVCQVDNRIVELPAPYLTEKTWKPLLAGRAFIPVGQSMTIECLEELGMEFQWLKKLQFDTSLSDDDRLLSIMELLEKCQSLSSDDLWMLTFEDAYHNLELIKSGKFAKKCDKLNSQSLQKILNWALTFAQ